MKAIILAGGKGTRLGNLTQNIQKCMIDINGKPFLDYLITHLRNCGIYYIHLILNYRAAEVIQHYQNCPWVSTSLDDTGWDAILRALIIADTRHVIVNGDTLLPHLDYKKTEAMTVRQISHGIYQDCGIYRPYKKNTHTIYKGPFFEIGSVEGLEHARKELT